MPPKSEPLIFTTGDLLCLVGLCASCLPARRLAAWHAEPALALATAAAGSLVILESWFTALGFLHRSPPLASRLGGDLPGRARCPGSSAWEWPSASCSRSSGCRTVSADPDHRGPARTIASEHPKWPARNHNQSPSIDAASSRQGSRRCPATGPLLDPSSCTSSSSSSWSAARSSWAG